MKFYKLPNHSIRRSNFLSLDNGIPSHDTFGRVFSKLAPETFQQSLIAWMQASNDLVNNQVLSGVCLRKLSGDTTYSFESFEEK